jgi:hypothetical protein
MYVDFWMPFFEPKPLGISWNTIPEWGWSNVSDFNNFHFLIVERKFPLQVQ